MSETTNKTTYLKTGGGAVFQTSDQKRLDKTVTQSKKKVGEKNQWCLMRERLTPKSFGTHWLRMSLSFSLTTPGTPPRGLCFPTTDGPNTTLQPFVTFRCSKPPSSREGHLRGFTGGSNLPSPRVDQSASRAPHDRAGADATQDADQTTGQSQPQARPLWCALAVGLVERERIEAS